MTFFPSHLLKSAIFQKVAFLLFDSWEYMISHNEQTTWVLCPSRVYRNHYIITLIVCIWNSGPERATWEREFSKQQYSEVSSCLIRDSSLCFQLKSERENCLVWNKRKPHCTWRPNFVFRAFSLEPNWRKLCLLRCTLALSTEWLRNGAIYIRPIGATVYFDELN